MRKTSINKRTKEIYISITKGGRAGDYFSLMRSGQRQGIEIQIWLLKT